MALIVGGSEPWQGCDTDGRFGRTACTVGEVLAVPVSYGLPAREFDARLDIFVPARKVGLKQMRQRSSIEGHTKDADESSYKSSKAHTHWHHTEKHP